MVRTHGTSTTAESLLNSLQAQAGSSTVQSRNATGERTEVHVLVVQRRVSDDQYAVAFDSLFGSPQI